MQGNEITQTIARNISTARKSRGLTQRGLAEAINHSETAVRFWESGRREIGNEAMLALSKALGYAPQRVTQKSRINAGAIGTGYPNPQRSINPSNSGSGYP